ncbi:hypothetical protein PDE_02926 [Penicillium oxalicum 114-2]|uniref:FCP1 homology domain-containing protein n=1 Tax=Penicillium oxalicum (strain 114-2 / CGMCC 5302) TaxID=933388 RepID=S7ZH41_PENO1|nr:hypothetical protein PDE_02926 [Penicillium oxalicum 114-2]
MSGSNLAESQASNDRATSQPTSSPSAPASSAPADAPPKKNRLHLPIPSRRSSKTDQQPTSEKTAEATQDDPSRRGSRVSILNIARERSRASSRRSRRNQPDAPSVDKSPDTAQPTSSESNGPPKPLQKKGSRLFSFLSCCSSADVDGDDNAVPPKKTSKQPVTPNRLPTPDKTEAHAGDSSTAESKDPAYFGDEKAAAALAADHPRERDPSSSSPVEAQTDATPNTMLPTEVPHESSAPHKESAVPATGLVSESEDFVAKEDEQSSSTQIATFAETAPKTVAEEAGETPSQVEETAQTVTLLPPPPPPPVPEVAQDGGLRQQWLLPPALPHLANRKCLVLDLDETLVHSSFKVLERADFTIPVEIEGQYHNIYVIKRPGVDQFMKRVGELYEVVVFTASVSKYGDPLLDQLDIHNVIHHRLFRESCYNHQGNYVKDLSQVGRDLRETIIIDNSPTSYIFHPQHAIPISSWFSDAHDNELLDLIPVLEDLAKAEVQDVSMVLDITL